MKSSITILIFFSSIIFISNSCSILDPPDYLTDLWAAVDSVEVKSIVFGKVIFNCWTGVGTPCNEFDKVETKKENDTIFVRIYSKIERGQACTQVLDLKEFQIMVAAERNKTNHFKFWYIDNYRNTLDVFVP
jgi:hypothetical protein